MKLRYELPKGMRYATLKERRDFYKNEFDPARLEDWFRNWSFEGTVKFAVIIGRHTRIFPKMFEEDASTTIVIDEYRDFTDVKRQILDFLPESAYYDRNVYGEKQRVTGQELAFDLDPENLTCPIHGTLADKMNLRQGLAFCEIELNMVRQMAIRLHEELSKQFFNMHIVYSGRGFHIHVFDPEPFTWKRTQRKTLALELKRKGYLIDEWVTTGGMRLIRLPFSLHGMVSRIVTPVDIKELDRFDPVRDERCLPRFLK